MLTAPLVSIVLATYNRSAILGHAIESVRRSTLQSWELIVVGDGCTDNTVDVVASFDDPRITFVNLERNVGEQSGPNNEGLQRLRGRYVAYLNHDDLYFPDHLQQAVDHLDRTKADLVWSPTLTALPASTEELADGRWPMLLTAVTSSDDYDPAVFVFASAWVMTRELAARIGPWRHAYETYITPSQDWLFRAWKSGARLRQLPHPSVLAIPAQPRKGSYVQVTSPEHNFFAARMQDDPLFRERALARAAIRAAVDARQPRPGRALRSIVVRPLVACATRLGFHPHAPLLALRYGGRGGLVNRIRRQTGLGRLTRQQKG